MTGPFTCGFGRYGMVAPLGGLCVEKKHKKRERETVRTYLLVGKNSVRLQQKKSIMKTSACWRHLDWFELCFAFVVYIV